MYATITLDDNSQLHFSHESSYNLTSCYFHEIIELVCKKTRASKQDKAKLGYCLPTLAQQTNLYITARA